MNTELKINQLDNQTVDSLIYNQLFYHHYQPLYALSNWKLYGYEAFFRSDFSLNPELVFQFAKKNRKLFELDTASIFNAALFYFISKENILLGLKKTLFVNVFPSTLLHPSFSNFLERLISENMIIPSKNIVFEINESEIIWDIPSLRQVIHCLRNNGFSVAFDDVGKGTASIQNIVEFEPEFVKLDRYFSVDLAVSEKKQRMVQLFVDYCSDGSRLVLEGIEKPEDLAIAKMLGVQIGQGYILGKAQRYGER
jgi:EAL domain-containing protein (putative c-di-GMP-specific phosphodiesterase class I)